MKTMEIENPEIEKIRNLIDSESYDIPEKTLMEIEHDYQFYKSTIKWEDHILKLASKELI